MLVVGSALEVHPVADLPLETLRNGGSLAIVNRGPTALDGQAELRIDGSAGETLAAVLAALDEAGWAAIRRRGRSSSTCRQDEHTLRSTSYGTPAC